MRLRKNAKSASILRLMFAGAAFALTVNAAAAASCPSLTSELRRLEAGSGSQSPAARKWSTAKHQQQKALNAAERDASYFGCASTRSAKCQGLNGKIKRMRANLSAIERQLAKSGGGSARNAKRLRQVRAALARQNCNAPAQAREARRQTNHGGDKPRSLLSRLFSSERKVELATANTGDREIATVRSQSRQSPRRVSLPSGGAFRTLCVRTCDGYFFPVSFSTGKSQFVNDEARCSEICPAAETELYVYRNPGGDQSEMMSLAGHLYSEQPFAYRYKSEFVEGCSCRQTRQSKTRSSWTELSAASGNRVFFSDISAGLPRRTLQPSRGGTFEEGGSTTSPFAKTALQRAQLPPYEDPGTRFNLEKGFDVTADLDLVRKRLNGEPEEIASSAKLVDGLPLLSARRASTAEDEEIAAVSPVFKNNDQGFQPAAERKAAVRVVGPEYFVAQ